jgi:predicted DNA-binding ribbon-helix-helix protein
VNRKSGRPIRPSDLVAEAAKLERESEHRLLVRLSKSSWRSLKVAAAERNTTIKNLLLSLARDAGIKINPADLRDPADE